MASSLKVLPRGDRTDNGRIYFWSSVGEQTVDKSGISSPSLNAYAFDVEVTAVFPDPLVLDMLYNAFAADDVLVLLTTPPPLFDGVGIC